MHDVTYTSGSCVTSVCTVKRFHDYKSELTGIVMLYDAAPNGTIMSNVDSLRNPRHNVVDMCCIHHIKTDYKPIIPASWHHSGICWRGNHAITRCPEC